MDRSRPPVVVRSTVRQGRLVRCEREEDDGRIRSWVLAGDRGAVEMRGVSRYQLYALAHLPGDDYQASHSTLVLVDADVFPDSRCTVLEGPCHAVLLAHVLHNTVLAGGPWEWLETLYRRHLEEP